MKVRPWKVHDYTPLKRWRIFEDYAQKKLRVLRTFEKQNLRALRTFADMRTFEDYTHLKKSDNTFINFPIWVKLG